MIEGYHNFSLYGYPVLDIEDAGKGAAL